MKQYYVVRMYENIMPSIVEVFTNLDNAKEYARILNEEKGDKYGVFELIVSFNGQMKKK